MTETQITESIKTKVTPWIPQTAWDIPELCTLDNIWDKVKDDLTEERISFELSPEMIDEFVSFEEFVYEQMMDLM